MRVKKRKIKLRTNKKKNYIVVVVIRSHLKFASAPLSM